MPFEVMTAQRILFGEGMAHKVGELAREFGKRALLVTGSNPERARFVLDQLRKAHIDTLTYAVSAEPTVELVLNGVEIVKSHRADMVIAIGGGSVLDAAKAIAAFATNDGDPFNHLEVIGKGQPIQHTPLPMIAIPTTAGTGSEVTRNAVLSSAEHHTKVSMRSPLMLPTIALVDPVLTYDLPPQLTAYTGMDALTQVIEPYVTPFSNPFTDALCEDAIRRASHALMTAYQAPHDIEARRDMALVSLFGGLALANARLGAVHGFANPIGGMFDAPHGAICGILLPHVMAMNVRKLRVENNALVSRFDSIGRLLLGDSQATAEDGVAWVAQIAHTLNLPTLRSFGITPADLPAIVEKSAQASSMKGNPVSLTPDDMTEILQNAL